MAGDLYWIYEGVSTSAFRNVVMTPLNLNGIMTIFWKAEVDSPTYVSTAIRIVGFTVNGYFTKATDKI